MAERSDPFERLLGEGVRAGVCPGAAWAVGDARTTLSAGAVGLLDPARPAEPMRPDTVFDVASLTKILAVWAVVGTLVDAGKLDLTAPLGTYWPEVSGRPVADATALHLLTHTAGLPLRANLRHLYGSDPQDVRDGVLAEALRHRPGAAVAYTDRAALILGWLAEHLTGLPLPRLAEERIWTPLGMTETRYGPLPPAVVERCAPTEYDEESGAHLKGTVHDFSARLLGGACGIAGVFTTTADVGRFLRRMLDPARGRPSPARPTYGHRPTRGPRTGGRRPSRPGGTRDPGRCRPRGPRRRCGSGRARSTRRGGCSGTRRPAPARPTTSGPTSASPAPPCGSPRPAAAGPSCSRTGSTRPGTRARSPGCGTPSARTPSAPTRTPCPAPARSPEGGARDSAVFSVIAEEGPERRERPERRLAAVGERRAVQVGRSGRRRTVVRPRRIPGE